MRLQIKERQERGVIGKGVNSADRHRSVVMTRIIPRTKRNRPTSDRNVILLGTDSVKPGTEVCPTNRRNTKTRITDFFDKGEKLIII
jgi:hypothetical protein